MGVKGGAVGRKVQWHIRRREAGAIAPCAGERRRRLLLRIALARVWAPPQPRLPPTNTWRAPRGGGGAHRRCSSCPPHPRAPTPASPGHQPGSSSAPGGGRKSGEAGRAADLGDAALMLSRCAEGDESRLVRSLALARLPSLILAGEGSRGLMARRDPRHVLPCPPPGAAAATEPLVPFGPYTRCAPPQPLQPAQARQV